MSNTSLDSLATFVVIARTGSVTAGADELGLSQSTASAQMIALEKQLGFRLFQRTPRGVVLTSRGRELLDRVGDRVESALDAAVRATSTAARLESSVALAGPAEFVSEMILPGIETWSPPGVAVHVRFGTAPDLLEQLRDSAVDLVVSTVQPRIKGIEYVPLVDELFHLVMAPHLVDRFGDDPDAVPVVAYAGNLPIVRRYWSSVFERSSTALRAVATVPDLRVVAELAAAGIGMSVLPDYLAEPYLRSGRLVDPVRPELPPLNTIYLARRRTKPGAASGIEDIADAIRAYVRSRRRPPT